MGKCSSCGVETQAYKIHEDGDWNWYCGKCHREIIERRKKKKVAYIKEPYGFPRELSQIDLYKDEINKDAKEIWKD